MRQRHTHRATVYGERDVGTNELRTTQTVTDDAKLEVPVRVESSREEVDLDETGARIETEPFAIAPVYGRDPSTGDMVATMEHVAIGDNLALSPGWDTKDRHYRIVDVNMLRGRGNAPQNVSMTLAHYGEQEN